MIGKDGKIKVDKKEADLVRKIFMLYAKQKSMQKVAEVMKSSGFISRQGEKINFSVVSDILHDNRYLSKELPQSIVPISLFKKTQEILHRSSTDSKIIKYF
jgi:flagellar biosynthesis regulator FlaF